jgi:hypothetical protein
MISGGKSGTRRTIIWGLTGGFALSCAARVSQSDDGGAADSGHDGTVGNAGTAGSIGRGGSAAAGGSLGSSGSAGRGGSASSIETFDAMGGSGDDGSAGTHGGGGVDGGAIGSPRRCGSGLPCAAGAKCQLASWEWSLSCECDPSGHFFCSANDITGLSGGDVTCIGCYGSGDSGGRTCKQSNGYCTKTCGCNNEGCTMECSGTGPATEEGTVCDENFCKDPFFVPGLCSFEQGACAYSVGCSPFKVTGRCD